MDRIVEGVEGKGSMCEDHSDARKDVYTAEQRYTFKFIEYEDLINSGEEINSRQTANA